MAMRLDRRGRHSQCHPAKAIATTAVAPTIPFQKDAWHSSVWPASCTKEPPRSSKTPISASARVSASAAGIKELRPKNPIVRSANVAGFPSRPNARIKAPAISMATPMVETRFTALTVAPTVARRPLGDLRAASVTGPWARIPLARAPQQKTPRRGGGASSGVTTGRRDMYLYICGSVGGRWAL